MYRIVKINYNSNVELENKLNEFRLSKCKVLQILNININKSFSTADVLLDGVKLSKSLREFNNCKEVLDCMSDIQIEFLNDLLDLGIRPDNGYCSTLSHEAVMQMVFNDINIFE